MNYDFDDAQFEFNARHDYIREAYGDPCPCGRALRWGADCPACERDAQGDDGDDTAASAQVDPDPAGVDYFPPDDPGPVDLDFDEDDLPF